MKKLLLFMLATVCVCGAAEAKQPTETARFLTDVHCSKCVDRVMNNIGVMGKGIVDLEIDVESKIAEVKYNPAKTSPEVIIERFKKLKVNAQSLEGGECPHEVEHSHGCEDGGCC